MCDARFSLPEGNIERHSQTVKRRRQTSFFLSMPAAFSDIHPTLYVVSPWWNRLGRLCVVWPTKNWLSYSKNRIQGFSENAAGMP